MSDTAETTIVHLTAEEHLADLQARALNGEPVQATDLAEARAAVELETLAAEGQSRRDRKAAEKAAEQEQADAKKAAADTIGRVNPKVALKAFDAAVEALEKLYTTTEGYNDTIQSIGDDFDRAGVSSRSSISAERERDPHAYRIDPQNHAVPDVSGGGRYTSVKVDGVVYGRLRTSEWLAHALGQVAKRHAGLPMDFSASVSKRLDLSRPHNTALAEHLSMN